VQRIGVFDSGLGGLSVWREIRRTLPGVDTVYVADQAHMPYGPLSPQTVLDHSRGITAYLEKSGCQSVVIACNTASAAALHTLRADRPDLTLIGMEPAIKPAVEMSRSGTVVVLATPTTLEGALFQETLQRVARDARVLRQPCPGLVEQIERGETNSPATREMLRVFLEHPIHAGADVCVLGCTHYVFVRPLLVELVGDVMQIIDPAPAIARRVATLIGTVPQRTSPPLHALYTTGRPADFDRVASGLLDEPVASRGLIWRDGRLLGADAG
jgi:glutamate racemase